MTHEKSIANKHEHYIPHFQIKSAGQPHSSEVVHDILSISYQDGIDEIDSFSITISNWDADRRTCKYSDSKLFDPGQQIELYMGYYDSGRLTLMIRGEITSLAPMFPSSGPPTLTISGVNPLYRFKTQPESAVYEDMTDNQIAHEIGRKLGITIETSDAPARKHAHLVQSNQDPILFLKERARRIGYDLSIKDDSKLFFGPNKTAKQAANLALTYGQSLIQFSPSLTITRQLGSVTTIGQGQAAGIPDLRAGTTLKLNGLGKRFGGEYLITEATHTIDDGSYLTEFSCQQQEGS